MRQELGWIQLTTILVSIPEMAMAADRQTTIGNTKATCENKIIPLKKGKRAVLVGLAGPVDIGWKLLKWFNKNFWAANWNSKFTEKELEQSELLVLENNGTLYHFSGCTVPVLIDDPYLGAGTGDKYGVGALYAGAKLHEAILIASQCDINTGLGVQYESFNSGGGFNESV